MLERLKNLVFEEEGQALTEYGLIIALIAVVVIAGLAAIGTGLYDGAGGGIFDKIIAELTTP